MSSFLSEEAFAEFRFEVTHLNPQLMNLNHESVWANCLSFIEDNVSAQAFKTWFIPIKSVKLEESVLTIQVPSQFFYEWLEEHYVDLLRKAIGKELGKEARLEYSIIMEY